MYRVITVFLLLAVALPCHAQGDKQKSNTLTPKEIADGWILLFDGESMFGWKGEKWKVDEGHLVATGDNLHVLASNAEFGNYELYFEYKYTKKVEYLSQVIVACDAAPTPLKVKDFESLPPGRKIELFQLRNTMNWQQVTLTVFAGVVKQHEQIDQVNGGKSGGKAGPVVREGQYPVVRGHVAIAGNHVVVRSVKLRPLNAQPLFNGTDLTGWTVFPKKKSQFTVQDGAITVKDGPGDLQTVGKYKDFVLQLECKSNGKHLNSGIFFRCRDGEYQNGYEAQIRNEFKEEPQKYLVEEYDPETNKLIGKKEVLSPAVDFGTGAVYRRQPARKQMSKDGEWFTMTIVAHGNHIATWVNGVQVTDWYDHRPKSDNARTGCRLEAGHISIQGHDPTTDLSFRNLRIAELK